MNSNKRTSAPLSNNNTNTLQNKYSRYVGGGVTEVANGYIEWWERFNFERDSTDVVYVVENKYQNRLDLIASLFYNEPRYAWFLAQYNNILDPFSEVLGGRVLLIPTADRMTLMLGTRKGGNPSTRKPVSIIKPIIS